MVLLNKHLEPDLREWLVTNKLGGYASSTLSNINTRKYHGLLVACADGEQRLMVSKIDEVVEPGGGVAVPIYSNQYSDGVSPSGSKHLRDVSIGPYPTFTYRVGDIMTRKSVLMPELENATIVKYHTVNRGAPAKMSANLLVNSRSTHSLTKKGSVEFAYKQLDQRSAVIIPSNRIDQMIAIGTTGAVLRAPYRDNWHYNMYYDLEAQRGYGAVEDHYIGAHLSFGLPYGVSKNEVVMAASSSEKSAVKTLNRLLKKYSVREGHSTDSWLSLASDQFIVKRGNHYSVIAGYHWFSEWGRDAMISIPGLLLAQDRPMKAKSVLEYYASLMKNGVIPNQARANPAYNTADASLWFVNACWHYFDQTHDKNFARFLWPAIKEVIDSYIAGTDFGIGMDRDALIECRTPAMTWMDAVVDGKAVTPRAGKAVEIQALWYNALKIASQLAINFHMGNEYADEYEAIASEVRKNFNNKFWNPAGACLYDCIGDASIRPNQLLAISLQFPLLSSPHWPKVLETVTGHLLTPYGLRTLSPVDPGYVGKYAGNQAERDRAYHQGTVWPWLIGSYIDAYLRVNGEDSISRRYCYTLVQTLLDSMWDSGVGHISEVFDGDAPHRPGGCIAQAWNIAEISRALKIIL